MRALRVIAMVLGVACFCTPVLGAMGSKTLQYGLDGYTDTQDAYIDYYDENGNHGSLFYAFVTVRTGDDSRKSTPLRFGLLPWMYDSSVTIHEAKLGLYVYTLIDLDLERDFIYVSPYVIDPDRAWEETQVTWIVYKTGNSWTEEGCEDVIEDRAGSRHSGDNYRMFDENSAVDQYYDWTVTGSVNHWKAGNTNRGWLMRFEANDGGPEEGIGFYTKNQTHQNKRPYLNVTWTQTPVADANGGYECLYGGMVGLDGTGSYERDVGDLIDYVWDLDLDGQFDDATGSLSFATWDYLVNDLGLTPGLTHEIRLRVRDDDNEWSEPDSSNLFIDVPEPATLGLLLIGGLALLRRRR